ncbi:MAG: hypothetical protein M0R21_13030 [Lentimicrobiaceae bacterium]|jgi:hypothetical protein|nr:hypothetical protein [Lentimicrobiaceae bacterium]
MDNKIDIQMTQEVYDEVMKAFATIKEKMPFLTKLSKEEVDNLLIMDERRKPFVDKALEYATRIPDINPGAELLAHGKNDNQLHTQLTTLLQEANRLSEMITDTRRLAGAEAFVLARFIYMDAKMKLKMKVPGMQSIVDDLGRQFDAQGNFTAKPKAE